MRAITILAVLAAVLSGCATEATTSDCMPHYGLRANGSTTQSAVTACPTKAP